MFVNRKNQDSARRVEFFVLGIQRTGSTFLKEYLNAFELVYCYPKMFIGEGALPLDRDRTRSNLFCDNTDKEFREYLDSLYGKKWSSARACGFKIMLAQLKRYPLVLTELFRREALCVLITRQNVIDIYISGELARKTKVYRVRDERDSDKLRETKLEVNTDHLVEKLRKIDTDLKEIRSISKYFKTLSVDYDDLVTNGDAVVASIAPFFSVPAGSLGEPPTLKKVNKAPREELISNYGPFHEAIAKTEFRKFL